MEKVNDNLCFLLQIRNHHHISEESVQPQLRKLAVFFLDNEKCENENVSNINCRKGLIELNSMN